MIQKIKDILMMNDLSEQEVQVYIALLKLREATIPMIREKCGLPNITVYRSIQALLERALITQESLNKKQSMYKPLSLETLVQKTSAMQRKLRRMELDLKNLDPLLPYINEHESSILPEIEVRMGIDAFREEYLKMPDMCQGEFLYIGNVANFWQIAGLDYDAPEERSFINKRLRKDIFARGIDVRSSVTEEIHDNDSREKRTMRLVDETPLTKDSIVISEKHVVHFVNDMENPRVVIMRNPELVATHHALFGKLWAS